MNVEKLQEQVLAIYRRELQHEQKYQNQFQRVIEKNSDILYGKLMKLNKGENITNVDLFGPKQLLAKISDIIENTLKQITKDLNIEGNLYQATVAINTDIKKQLDVSVDENSEEIKKQVNEKNGIDNMTLKQRVQKYRSEFYNKLLNTVVINVAKKKDLIVVADDIDEQIRDLLYIHGRLMGTEMNRILNQNLLSIYTALGIKNVEFSAVLDDKTSYICTMHHGRVYPINELIAGITQPPLHPNCRSILLPHN